MTVGELRALLDGLPDDLRLQASATGNLMLLRGRTYVGYVCFRKGEVVLRKAFYRDEPQQ